MTALFHKSRFYITPLFVIAVITMLPVSNVLAHAGKVLFASGEVTVKSKRHNNTVLKRGSKVWPGDIVKTGKDSSVQIRSGDGSFISLKADSKLIIAAHKHTGPVDKQHSSIELVKGGMRAVTGLIGKNKPDNYKIKARGSTIGIRGTEFVVQICDKEECNQSKAGEKKKAAKSGVYVGVVNGAITVEKNKKKVELDASLNVVLGVSMGVSKDKFQYVHIDDKPPEKEEAPVVLKEPPKILVKAMAPPAPTLESDKKGDKKAVKNKPSHNLKPYEGINVAALQEHITSTAPIDEARSPIEEFEALEYPSKPYVFTPHREIRANYRGRDTSDGQNYDLSEGYPKLDNGP